jgi:Tfp pilus assembly protein PilE
MVAILEMIVVVMIASVLTNISAWGYVASKFEIIAKTEKIISAP